VAGSAAALGERSFSREQERAADRFGSRWSPPSTVTWRARRTPAPAGRRGQRTPPARGELARHASAQLGSRGRARGPGAATGLPDAGCAHAVAAGPARSLASARVVVQLGRQRPLRAAPPHRRCERGRGRGRAARGRAHGVGGARRRQWALLLAARRHRWLAADARGPSGIARHDPTRARLVRAAPRCTRSARAACARPALENLGDVDVQALGGALALPRTARRTLPISRRACPPAPAPRGRGLWRCAT
jgi:hypothetical protein